MLQTREDRMDETTTGSCTRSDRAHTPRGTVGRVHAGIPKNVDLMITRIRTTIHSIAILLR